MYRVIAPTPPGTPPSDPSFSFLSLSFFFLSESLPRSFHPSASLSACHCVRSFAAAGGTAGSFMEIFVLRRRSDRSRPVEAFNFHAAICRAAAFAQLSPKSYSSHSGNSRVSFHGCIPVDCGIDGCCNFRSPTFTTSFQGFQAALIWGLRPQIRSQIRAIIP